MKYLLIERSVRYQIMIEAPPDGSTPPVELQDMEVVDDFTEVFDVEIRVEEANAA